MKIIFKAEDQCDYYFCFETNEENKIILPENITLQNFLLFLQGSLDQIRPVIILKNAEAQREINLGQLKSTHYVLEDNFLFLNYSIRNLLKSEMSAIELKKFEDIRISLIKILKN